MKSIKKLALFGIMAASLLAFVPAKASAQYGDYGMGSSNIYGGGYGNYGYSMHRYPMVRFSTGSDYFKSPYFMYRYRHMYNYMPDYLMSRRVIFMDRDNPYRTIAVQNYLTGPNSLNVATVRVDSDFFDELSSNIDLNQNFDVAVDTGGNTVSFNTIAGDLITGSADVSIY